MQQNYIRLNTAIFDWMFMGSLSASDYIITPDSEGPVERLDQDSFRDRLPQNFFDNRR
jgi:hypothetical protein